MNEPIESAGHDHSGHNHVQASFAKKCKDGHANWNDNNVNKN